MAGVKGVEEEEGETPSKLLVLDLVIIPWGEGGGEGVGEGVVTVVVSGGTTGSGDGFRVIVGVGEGGVFAVFLLIDLVVMRAGGVGVGVGEEEEEEERV